MNKNEINWIKAITFLLLVIASAYASFTIPVTETGIPFTMQSLTIFILTAFMRPAMSAIVIGSYLILGLIGMPVFAEGSSGLDSFTGGSGGFLYGFFFSALFISNAIVKQKMNSLVRLLSVFVYATFILFFFGIFHLTLLYGFDKAINYGLIPFWKMGLLKSLIAAIFVFILIKSDIYRLKFNSNKH